MGTIRSRRVIRAALAIGIASSLWLVLGVAQAQRAGSGPGSPALRIVSPPAGSTAILIQPDEPGQRLLIVGRIENTAGRPIAGASVTAYNTDAQGLYNPVSAGTREPRIRGTVLTDADGRFQMLTVRPAPYPSGDEPAHVHFMINAPSYVMTFSDIWFEGDPLITRERLDDAQRDMDAHRELNLQVRPVETGPGGLQTVRHTVVLQGD